MSDKRSLRRTFIVSDIRDKNGHCLFVVKDNQPALKAGIAEAFGHYVQFAQRRHRNFRGSGIAIRDYRAEAN